jgi:hypothetical protein
MIRIWFRGGREGDGGEETRVVNVRVAAGGGIIIIIIKQVWSGYTYCIVVVGMAR